MKEESFGQNALYFKVVVLVTKKGNESKIIKQWGTEREREKVVYAYVSERVCICAHVRECVRECVRACVRACVRVCVCVCVKPRICNYKI